MPVPSRWWSALPATPIRVLRALAIVNVVAQCGITVTGSIVRVSESGLGCPTWPDCSGSSLVPIAHPELGQLHQWIEFTNRLLGGVVGVVGVLVFLAALLARPRRRRQVLLALTMPLGVVLQAVIGGLTVLTKLSWWTVSLHFLPSPGLVWLAVLLLRTVDEGDEPARPLIPRPLRGLQLAMAADVAAVLVAGTLVTAAGPHAGDIRTPRLNLPVENLAQLHADIVFILVGMLTALGFALRIAGGTPAIWRRYWLFVVTVLAQGALGLIQYFLGVPDMLVILHVLGATLVVAAMAALWCACRDRGPRPAGTPADTTVPTTERATTP
ncbi:MAG TPA: COX15/CtaA family protein [Pseudonocardiaceae bacterium]|nr:COX15/CtaA family protein [Pseudonocardiaceae bacterium]